MTSTKLFVHVGCILGSFLQLNFQFVPKKRKKKKDINQIVYLLTTSVVFMSQCIQNIFLNL